MKALFLKLKNKKIVVLIIVIGLVCAIIGVKLFMPKGSDNQGALTDIKRTVTIERGTLKDSIDIKGIIKSEESSSVTPTLPAKVMELNVKVGDIVKKGDVIAVLDNSSIKEEIEKKKKEIGEEKSNLKLAFDRLTKQQEEAAQRKNDVINEQTRLVNQAQTAYDQAVRNASNYTSTLNSAKGNFENAKIEVEKRRNELSNKESILQQRYTEWMNNGGTDSSTGYTEYQTAKAELEAASKEFENAKNVFNYDEYEKNYNTAVEQSNNLNQTMTEAKNRLDNSKNDRDKAIKSEDKNIQDLNLQALDAKKKWETYNGSDALKELDKKMEESVLKAETSGKITELKVTVGSVPKESIATIESVDKLIMEATVQAYDIAKVKEGQKVIITNSTNDKQVEGTILRVSPTATTSENTSGFLVQIKVSASDNLYVGTKVNGEIIISEKQNVLTVPKDAVFQDDEGGHIKVQGEDGEFKDMLVTVVEQNEFFVEISGKDVKEGLEVLAVYEWDNLVNNQRDKIEAEDNVQ
ncbi:MAG: HlyD family efflux transporter periplasmic adaptor subunit [Erysipelotrichaceae bacterium]